MFSFGGRAAEALTLRRKRGRISFLGAAARPARGARHPPKRCVYQFTQKPFFRGHGPPQNSLTKSNFFQFFALLPQLDSNGLCCFCSVVSVLFCVNFFVCLVWPGWPNREYKWFQLGFTNQTVCPGSYWSWWWHSLAQIYVFHFFCIASAHGSLSAFEYRNIAPFLNLDFLIWNYFYHLLRVD